MNPSFFLKTGVVCLVLFAQGCVFENSKASKANAASIAEEKRLADAFNAESRPGWKPATIAEVAEIRNAIEGLGEFTKCPRDIATRLHINQYVQRKARMGPSNWRDFIWLNHDFSLVFEHPPIPIESGNIDYLLNGSPPDATTLHASGKGVSFASTTGIFLYYKGRVIAKWSARLAKPGA